MVEVTLTRLAFSWIAGFLMQSLFVQQGSKFGSTRGYFLIGSLIGMGVFFTTLIFVYPLVIT